MRDIEQWWAVAAGAVGLVAWVAGSLVAAVPPVDRPVTDAVADLARRRSAVLAGSVLSVAGTALLLWPISAVAATGGPDVWASLALGSVAVAGVGYAVLGVATVLVAAVAWLGPDGVEPALARLALVIAHLATWSVSAPIGAASVVATTIVAVQADLAGGLLAALAAVKVATVGIEVAGTGRRTGWNAGGWAYGVSGYASVAWFGALLVALAP